MISYKELFFCKRIIVLSRLSNFASWIIIRRILRKSYTSLKAKDYHVINFLLSFLGHEIPILIIIAAQMLCNDTWSRRHEYIVWDCYFMMTSIQSFPRDTWHSYATVMRVFIMCMMGERKLCLVSPYVPIPQRECQLYDIQKTNNRYRYELTAVTISTLILRKHNISCVFCILLLAFWGTLDFTAALHI